MEKITKCTEELVAVIKTSDAYTKFTAAKEKLKEQPELYGKVNRFRKQNYVLQNSADDVDWLDKLKAFEKDNEELRRSADVENFLRSELEICRMMQRINVALVQEIDLCIEEFADHVNW